MAMQSAEKIWMNGTWVAWDDAKIHVLAHVAHYASSVFEGIRAYSQKRGGSAVFRLEEHIDRLMLSAKIYRMEIPYTRDAIRDVCIDIVAANDLKSCYIRPLVYRGYENLGVNPFGSPVEVCIAAFPWGKYLGDEAVSKGVAVKVSSWNRLAPNTLPAMAKASANYMNSQLMKMEALVDGYVEAVGLDIHGMISEGSGQNIFVVYKGELITPPLTSSVLAGITRDSVTVIAKDLGYRVREEAMPREMLYAADELFYSGTAVEVSPITSVDRIQVGDGEVGPITRAIQKAFFDIVNGDARDKWNWLTPVPQPAETAAPEARS